MKAEHSRENLSCGRRWRGPIPGLELNVWHLCRSHIVETGECVCPCGACSLRQKDEEIAS